MKKQSIFVIGIVVVVISCLGEGALSILEHEQWSNYAQTWEVQWASVNNKKVKKPAQGIIVRSEKLAHKTRAAGEDHKSPLDVSKQ